MATMETAIASPLALSGLLHTQTHSQSPTYGCAYTSSGSSAVCTVQGSRAYQRSWHYQSSPASATFATAAEQRLKIALQPTSIPQSTSVCACMCASVWHMPQKQNHKSTSSRICTSSTSVSCRVWRQFAIGCQ